MTQEAPPRPREALPAIPAQEGAVVDTGLPASLADRLTLKGRGRRGSWKVLSSNRSRTWYRAAMEGWLAESHDDDHELDRQRVRAILAGSARRLA